MTSKSALGTGAADHLPMAGYRTTRSNSKVAAQQSPITSPQQATQEKKKNKAKESKEDEMTARKFLIEEKVLQEGTGVTFQTLTRALSLTTQKHGTSAPPNLTKTLQAIITLLQEANNMSAQFTPVLETLTQKIGERVEKSLHEELNKMSNTLKSSLADQCKALGSPDSLTETVASLKQVASDMTKTIGEATTATTQITDTAHSYKQALLQAAPREFQAQPRGTLQSDPRIMRDMDRKARQILIDTADPRIMNVSQDEIKEKVRSSIAEITDLPPPQDTRIAEISKLKKGGLTILFKEKDVVLWLQDPETRRKFLLGVAMDATISNRSYPILVPRIPITFNPADDNHLREVEETNDLPAGTIEKARWIKPEQRRAIGQRAAHAIFTLKDITEANRCIRDGLKICGLRIRPSRLKHEPLQCMKCRKWGHFANACTATTDTCGTCGGDHRSKDCTQYGKAYCVSCRSDAHASWDRDCPEFRRRCEQFNENYPENSLTYFPTEEEWTLMPQPSRYQYAEKFPPRFEVSALSQPTRTNHAPAPKPVTRQRKQPNTKPPPNQRTMDNFVTAGGSQRQPGDKEERVGNMLRTEDVDMAVPYFERDIGQEPQEHAWD
jgi:hypothetical protein